MKHREIMRAWLFGAALAGLMAPAAAQYQPIEPVALPAAVEQGVDMVYVDREIGVDIRWRNTRLDDANAEYAGARFDLAQTINPLYTDLRRALLRYQAEYGELPQFTIESGGPSLKLGAEGERVALLRERLGVPPGTLFDETVEQQVREYQRVHGLAVDGVAGNQLIASLNLGAVHYEQVLMINMERARRLPAPGELKRHIVVDAGAAQIFMYEGERLVDSMRAVVGSNATQTPMMAALLRYASVNPYWNLPPDFNVNMVAPRVLEQGVGYLTERKYEVFADWTESAEQLDPATVDWEAVRDGSLQLRIRRGPGPGNSMGDIKFMMPNDLGIYLHDTHDRNVFAQEDRWISNGCVRVEDAQRLAAWLFGEAPATGDPDVERRVDLDEPVAVFLTYFTAAATPDGVVFRADPYDRDRAVLVRYFGEKLALR